MHKLLISIAILIGLTVSQAQAHEGHGFPAGIPHTHAQDGLGWCLPLAMAALGLWLWRKLKS